MEYRLLGDVEIVRDIGRRIRAHRLNQNQSQAELAEAAGVALRTITNLERGKGCSLGTLIGVLRGLDLLSHLDRFIPEPGISPIELLKLNGKKRQRATGKRGKQEEKTSTPGMVMERKPWTWGEDD